MRPLGVRKTFPVGRIVVVFLVFVALIFVAATGTAIGERLPVKIYTTADGLGHNSVHRIVRDSRGFMWFCTFEGLSRFDGYGFTTYTVDHGLPSPVVNDLLETRDGQYWVATAAGLCRFNPKAIPGRANSGGRSGAQPSAANAMFEVYVPGENAKSRNVTVLLEDRGGTIWCGTTKGLYRVEQKNGEVAFHLVLGAPPIDPKNYVWVSSMIEDRSGALWLSSGYAIHRLFSDGRIEHYSKGRHGLPDAVVTCLLEDSNGRIWAGTEQGLCRLVSDPDLARPIVARLYTEKDGLPTNFIHRLFQSSDGRLWAASDRGLIQFIPTDDGADFRFRAYAQPHGLTVSGVGSLAEDRNGNLWLAMANGGAIKLARSGITAFEEADGLASAGTILRNRSGELLVIGGPFASRNHINRFDGARFTQIQLNLPSGVAYSWGSNQLVLEDHTGEWWVATNKGIYRFPRVNSFESLALARPKAVYTTRDGLAGNMILRLFEDSRGDIWISAVGQGAWLTRWERSTQTFHHYTVKDGLPLFEDSYPTSFSEDRTGAVWIGFSYSPSRSVSGGLVRARNDGFARFTSADGIPEGGIFNLFVDSSGRLWVPTTRGGVCRIDKPAAEQLTVITYTTADGLSSNDVESVTEDRWGRIYFGTGRGIDRLVPATGRIKHYTTADGALLGTPEPAMADRDGALWFSYPTGVIRLIPELEREPLAPPVLITGLRIAGDAQPVSALGEIEIPPVELPPDRNQLQIDFVALGFSPGEGLRYQYRLEGSTQDWSPPSEQRSVNFANLAPGRYRFLVRAVNADGVMSDVAASFAFRVLPPVWQRWWFVTIMCSLVGLAAYALYRYRVARLLELERVRTRIATDLHDDIGSSLSQIAIMSEVIQRQADVKDHRISRPLSVIAGTSRELVDSMADIVWSTDPQHDHLIDLTQRMRQFATDVLTARSVEFTFAAPGERDIPIETDVRREVFLIFKEAINNAVRHSNCSFVEISFSAEDHRLMLKVTDNGGGFDTARASAGHGLTSMKRRAESIGGELDIVSEAGRGAAITLKAPLRRRHMKIPTFSGGDSRADLE